MNARQLLALQHHVRLAGECVHPRFRYTAFPGSIVLTVNSGYE